MKIKVLHLIHKLSSGGAENGVINLLNNINNEKFSPSVCTFVGKGDQTYRLDKKKTIIYELNKRHGNDITIPRKLIKIFKKDKPHIIHTHGWGTLCEGVLSGKYAKIPIIIHGEHGTIQDKKWNIFVQRIFWRLANQILTVSYEHSKELCQRIGFNIEKIKVIPNGVDTNRFYTNKTNVYLRERLNFQQNDIVIGSVGRLVAVKNQSLLIKAFSIIVQKHSNVKLILVGDGPLKNVLQKRAKEYGLSSNIQFLGKRYDIPEIMASMDIFSLTSDSEGMSNTILEAMSSGLPVIATNVGGNKELIYQNATGILVPPKDVYALANALSYVIINKDIRKKMGRSGRKRAVEKFSIEEMVHGYEKLYMEWCNKKSIQ